MTSPSDTTALISINNQTYIAPCIAYLQSILPPSDVSAAMIHCRPENENDASDSWGLQGGQDWIQPTTMTPTTDRPTVKPTTRHPTTHPTRRTPSPSLSFVPTNSAPSYHPTLHDRLFVLRGTIYYDRNANGKRDSSVSDSEYGSNDIEFEYGLGGVNLRLVECDLENNKEVEMQWNPNKEEESGHWNSYSQTISLGYDATFHPQLAERRVDGGK